MVEFHIRDFGGRDGICRRDIDHSGAPPCPFQRDPTVSSFAATSRADAVALPGACSAEPVCWGADNCANVCCWSSQATIVLLGVDHDDATHQRMALAAKFGAQDLEGSGLGRREPEIGDRARDHVHLGAEFRHVEIMQHVDRAQQHLDRLADRQMQVGRFDDDIVLAVGIAWRSTPSGFSAVTSRVSDVPSLPSLPGRRKLHCHCWPTTSTIGRVARNGDELVPDEQAGHQHGGDADAGDDRQPPFEPLVLRFVGRPVAFPVTEAEDAIGHEQHDGGEDDAGDPEGDDDGVVDIVPVRGDRRPPPWAQEVEQHRAHDDQNEYKHYGHVPFLPVFQGARSRPGKIPSASCVICDRNSRAGCGSTEKA